MDREQRQIRIDESTLVQVFLCSAVMRLKENGWKAAQAHAAAPEIFEQVEKNLEDWREECSQTLAGYAKQDWPEKYDMEHQATKVLAPSFYALKGVQYANILTRRAAQLN